MSEQMLEEMRERLQQKGAFDRFKRKNEEETCGQMEMKITKLKNVMAERDKEPFLEVEMTDHILSESEAKELSLFFTKKEIDDLITKKYSAIKTTLPKRIILIQLSELQVLPKKPKRIISCQKCGISKEFDIDLCSFWELQKKYYCEGCKIEMERLNKSKDFQIPLIK